MDFNVIMNLTGRSGSQLIWIAPSGGRDRPDPSTGEWFPVSYLMECRDLICI